jgi:hypothetical protein
MSDIPFDLFPLPDVWILPDGPDRIRLAINARLVELIERKFITSTEPMLYGRKRGELEWGAIRPIDYEIDWLGSDPANPQPCAVRHFDVSYPLITGRDADRLDEIAISRAVLEELLRLSARLIAEGDTPAQAEPQRDIGEGVKPCGRRGSDAEIKAYIQKYLATPGSHSAPGAWEYVKRYFPEATRDRVRDLYRPVSPHGRRGRPRKNGGPKMAEK